jgi:hypothetical protein
VNEPYYSESQEDKDKGDEDVKEEWAKFLPVIRGTKTLDNSTMGNLFFIVPNTDERCRRIYVHMTAPPSSIH